MQTIELFSGTKSFSAVARRFGHKTFTVDNDNSFSPDLCKDINQVARARPSAQARHPLGVAAVRGIQRRRHREELASRRRARRRARPRRDQSRRAHARRHRLDGADMVVHREPARDAPQDAVHARTHPAHRHVLPVRRHAHEADRHLDERLVVDAAAALQERRQLSRRGAARLEDRHAGNRPRQRPRPHPARAVRGDILTAESRQR